jgi:alpha-ketoglutarate-dependent 2,4-dichlorophenoxyacetate dioxygenase
MSITFTPLHPLIGAECSGVDIGEPLSPQDAEKIHEGMDRYAVLVFRRGTPLTTPQHVAFASSLGEHEAPFTKILSNEGTRLDDSRLSDVSNLSPRSQLLGREDRKRLHALGNRLWHSDSSYKRIPARMSANSVSPPSGGITCATSAE